MTNVFLPAVAIANRMSFTAKLLSVVLIFLLPYLLVLTLGLQESRQQIHRVDWQMQGLGLVMELKPLALDVAKHRGNMAQFLAGAADRESSILGLESKIDGDLANLYKKSKSLTYNPEVLEQLASQWQQLKLSNTRSAIASKNFQNHSDLVAHVQKAIAWVADDFELVVQVSAKDHYLESLVTISMPQMVEELGQLRGKGASTLTDKVVTPNERVVLGSMAAAVDRFNSAVAQDMELLFEDPLVQGALKNANLDAHNALNEFFDITNKQILLADDITISGNNYFETGTKAIDAVTALDAQMTQVFFASIKKLHDEHSRRDFWMITFAVVVTALGLYLAVGILTSLNQSAKGLQDVATKLRDGDFSVKVEASSEDTLGDASKSLGGMVNSVAGLIHTIQQSAHEVNDLSVKLQTVADASKHELDQQNLQTQQSASAATEMAATVREVARSCSHVTEATEVARGSALEGRAKVNEAIVKINTLGADVERAKDIISQLQTDVTDIGAVLEVIRSIAEQTNLLALNAAIEAARAGEQGRGFAVVADEVRSLAKRTQDSTAEIRAVIETLQTRAETAVTIIHQSFTGAQDSVSSAAAAGQSLERIVVGVEQLRDLNTQIAAAAEQQAAVAEQMSLNTRHLCDSAENIMGQVENTVVYGASLRRGAVLLLDNAMKFKT